MMMRVIAVTVILVAMAASAAPKKQAGLVETSPVVVQDLAATRIEGEKRFQTNCGRCHMLPHKFPPRMMGTIVRHMRVRALITDEDMRYILTYMTE
ncbi:MAG TPA: cytochrome c [Terriglobales bacterium]|jgi:mono/diheme cytochrome c family protein|nr:cytochrome c [Terriglobales bacterium]